MTANEISGSAQLHGLTVQTGSVAGGIHYYRPVTDVPPPRQLPGVPRHFTDREDDVRALNTARESGATLIDICGIGGSGKSALAARWLSAGAYDDGQLYVDLCSQEGPLPSEAILRRWLRAFGFDRPPARSGELITLWRSVTATRAVAVLIDGATRPGQVRPLLPAGDRSTTVVTSRGALRDLAADGAVFHSLRPLGHQAAVQLLARFAGQVRVEASPRDAARLADRCFRLPLPLVLVGARLALRPEHSIAALSDALADRGLTTDTAREDPAHMTVDTALDGTYEDLEPVTQRVYRLLGLVPTLDVDPDLTAAVCEVPWAQAEWQLEILAEEQLLEPLPEVGGRVRYRLIPAARDHARRLAMQAHSDDDPARSLRQLCEWMLAVSTQAQTRLTPAQATLWQATMTPLPQVQAPFRTDPEALAWLESFGDSLLNVLHAATEASWPEVVWPLVDTFWPLFLRLHQYELWVAAHEIGLAAARQAGNAAAVRQMLLSGAIGLNASGRRNDAIRWYSEARDEARRTGDRRDEGQAALGLGACHHEAGRPDLARAFLAEAIGLWRDCAYPRGVALAQLTMGEADLADDAGRALEMFVEARAALLEVDDSYEVARALVLQGHARVLTGDVEAGIEEITTGLASLTAAGGTRWQARALEWLADAYCSNGDAAIARQHYQQAVELYKAIRPTDAERVRSLAVNL
ncbi:tetratricopeptide repeat protein [Streptomyces sp. NPDC051572]|uniref:tetratricopeptide repeat protein n=1 Tax=Streptomyces sp. NPDC051572 TaxID=3155802 RepID=UPI00344E14EE